MNRDFIVAGLVSFLGLSMLYKPIRDPAVVLLTTSRLVFPAFLGLLAVLLYLRLDLTTLIVIAIYLYIHNNSHINTSEDHRVHEELEVDDERFNPATSVDIQFADGTARHDPPSMLGWTKDASPLLLFPPSQDTLRSMSG